MLDSCAKGFRSSVAAAVASRRRLALLRDLPRHNDDRQVPGQGRAALMASRVLVMPPVRLTDG